jgi:hypothetical protein
MADPSAPVTRFLVALDLWATGVAIRRPAIRRAEPEASAEEVERQVKAWLMERPGAERGDGPAPTA